MQHRKDSHSQPMLSHLTLVGPNYVSAGKRSRGRWRRGQRLSASRRRRRRRRKCRSNARRDTCALAFGLSLELSRNYFQIFKQLKASRQEQRRRKQKRMCLAARNGPVELVGSKWNYELGRRLSSQSWPDRRRAASVVACVCGRYRRLCVCEVDDDDCSTGVH